MELTRGRLFIIILLLLMASCYREELIEPPVCDNCTRPVVLCFIAPGDSIKAYIAMSHSFQEDLSASDNIFHGLVYISDSSDERNQARLYNTAEFPQWYVASQKEMKIVPGKTYAMTLVGEDGLVSTAYAKVPERADRLEYCKIIGSQQEEGFEDLLMKCRWKKWSRFGNLVGFSKFNQEKSDYTSYVDYDIQISEIDSITRETVLSSTYADTFCITLYTLNASFDSYLKSYSLFVNISVGMQTNDITNMFNGIIPEYTNFNNSLGVLGAYLSDTLFIVNPSVTSQ